MQIKAIQLIKKFVLKHFLLLKKRELFMALLFNLINGDWVLAFPISYPENEFQ